ncbi:MAG TPA: PIG-L deacetylase family protein [bacterium]|nr:PIG-L deacetylase family protein [bacterium]
MNKKIIMAAMMFFLAAAAAGAAEPAGVLLEGVAPGPDGMIDVLTVFPHQDDESYAGGTLLALMDDPRVRVHIACLTLGDKSDARWFLGVDEDELGRIRSGELLSAAAVYQAVEVIQLDYHDQGLKGADQEELVKKIVAIIDRTGAEVVITHDPSGLTRHPDHVACSAAVTQAFPLSGARRLYYATQPWWLYAQTSTFTPFHEKAPHVKPTITVNIRPQLTLKRLAIYEHVSQRFFSLVGVLLEQDAFIPREWFALAAENQAAGSGG